MTEYTYPEQTWVNGQSGGTPVNAVRLQHMEDGIAGAAQSAAAAQSTADSKYSKPADGIPKTDLAADVQTSLGKADTAVQSDDLQDVGLYVKPSTGIPATDLDSSVQTSLGKAETAVQSSDLPGAATTTEAGTARLATSTEAVAGTVDQIIVTPTGLAAALAALNRFLPVEAGANVGRFRGFVTETPGNLVAGDWWWLIG